MECANDVNMKSIYLQNDILNIILRCVCQKNRIADDVILKFVNNCLNMTSL